MVGTTTSVYLPWEMVQEAKRLNINVSEVCRKALAEEIIKVQLPKYERRLQEIRECGSASY